MSRLDPYTCEAIANMLTRREREALADGSMSHLGGYAPRAAAWVRLFADAESASGPPSLGDWVRAAEVSQFGPCRWHVSTESDGEPHRLARIHLRWPAAMATAAVDIAEPDICHLGRADADAGGWSWTEMDSPAALTAALDALAAA